MPKSTTEKKSKTSCAPYPKKGSNSPNVMSMPAAQTKILNVLAARKVKLNNDEVDKKKLAGYADIAASTMRGALAKLAGEKLVIQTSEYVTITDLGMKLADPDAVDVPTTNDQKHKQVKEKKLTNDKQRALFDALIDGRTKDKTNVASSIGMDVKKSTWRGLVAKMAQDNIIEHQGKTIRLHKDMFPIVPRPEE